MREISFFGAAISGMLVFGVFGSMLTGGGTFVWAAMGFALGGWLAHYNDKNDTQIKNG
jgi:ABC-type Mn2+/Zn2+ transport system permease subunit